MLGRFLLEFFRKMQMFRKTKFRQKRQSFDFSQKIKKIQPRFNPSQVLTKKDTDWNYFVTFKRTVAPAAVSSLLFSSRRERQVVITHGHENTSPERYSHIISADCTVYRYPVIPTNYLGSSNFLLQIKFEKSRFSLWQRYNTFWFRRVAKAENK